MDTSLVMDIALDSLKVTILVAAPILAAALISGLLVGIIQAATSIQEMTLSFIPKLAVMVLSLVVFGEWQIAVLAEYFNDINQEPAHRPLTTRHSLQAHPTMEPIYVY